MSQTSTLVDSREYELGGERISYRYMTNAVGWLLHDTIVHPLTGIIGFVGRLCWSMRLMALSHHMHNVTAPNNDVLADYVEALQRASRNETSNNPTGEMTPDEQSYMLRKTAERTGLSESELLDKPWLEQVALAKGSGTAVGFNQAGGGRPPADDDKTNDQRAAEIELAEAKAQLAALESRPLPHQHDAQQYRRAIQAGEPMAMPVWLKALKAERDLLVQKIERIQAKLADLKGGLTLQEILDWPDRPRHDA
jgi:hypothetical protein